MNFKKLTAIVTTAMLTMGIMAGCGGNTKTTSTSEGKNEKTDVVVIGAGGAGLAAAVEVKNAGADVIVLEKMPMVGGNTLRATGGINAAGTKFQKEKKIQDSVDTFYKDTMKGGHDKGEPELVKLLTEKSAEAVEWLADLGADLTDVGRLGGASENRAHRPTGGGAVGSEIVKTLKKAAEDKKIDVRTMNKATEILKDDKGNITGVKAVDKEEKEYTIEAKAVIIATGGFGASEEMFVKYNDKLKGFGTTNHAGATGDGILMAEKLGAQLTQMEEIQTHPTVVPEKGIMITEAVRGNGAILVNREGKRFVNEMETRDVVSKAILQQEGKTSYLVFDENVRKSLKAIEKYIEMELTTVGNSPEDLAGKLKINADELKKTIDTYNGYVKAKKDNDFNRADMPTEFAKGNLYAIEIEPAVHHTMGGIKINTNAEVLNKDGQPIKGLYAAGEATGGIHGGNRLGGNALADLIVFGRIAGENAAKLAK
ncbi:flavocytochrome c [Clostridium cochlearium]|uniref:flavocytochrome c n=1 Tax=Clostridium cochlearium TaxID=1494 RepID=UPI000B94CE87|nr:flavocytochrome c [Clostridium cochlearium]SNV79290.1 fumarate reductase flavoprotein [Clostridium cochlearium]STA92746.1 fumarate reductase flavoprotein [Clostridium cochlearium]